MSSIAGLNKETARRRLAIELGGIFGRRLSATFLDVNRRTLKGKRDIEKFPITAEIVRKLQRSRWDDEHDPPGALKLVIHRAIDGLSDDIYVKHSSITFYRAARLMVGAVEVPVKPGKDRQEPNYEDFLHAALAEANLQQENTTRFSRDVREALAAELLRMWKESATQDMQNKSLEQSSEPSSSALTAQEKPVPAALDPFVQETVETPYVRRDEYHRSFSELVSAGHKVILLAGDSGNGKSRLAREIIAEAVQGDRRQYLLLDADDASSLLSSVARELSGLGTAASSDWMLVLLSLMNTERAPKFVLLDNVTDWRTVQDIGKAAGRCGVVATSTSDVFAGMVPYARMDIDAMPLSQSLAMIEMLLSETEQRNQARQLNTALGGKPLAIEQVCAYLSADGLGSVSDFLGELHTNAAEAMRLPLGDPQRTLTAVYENSLAALRAEGEPSPTYWLACVISHLNDTPIPADVLEQAFRSRGESISQGSFVRAVRDLQLRKLIKYHDGSIVMHSLTQGVLRSLLSDNTEEICRVIYPALSEPFRGVKLSEPLDEALCALSGHLARVLVGITKVAEEEMSAMDMGRVFSVALQGLRQSGRRKQRYELVNHGLRWVYTRGNNPFQDVTHPFLIYWTALHDQYLDGNIGRVDYANSIIENNSLARDRGVDLASVPGIGVSIIQIPALLWRFDEVKQLYRSIVEPLYAERASVSPMRMGNLLTMVGDAELERGNYSEALAQYCNAIRVYVTGISRELKKNVEPASCMAGLSLAVLRAHELASMPAIVRHELDRETLRTYVNSRITQRFLDKERDNFGIGMFGLAARLHYKAKRELRIAVRDLRAASEEGKSPSKEFIDETWLALYEKAESTYVAAGASRYLGQLFYDWSLSVASHAAIRDTSSRRLLGISRKLLAAAEEVARRNQEYFLLDRCKLLRIKLRIIDQSFERDDFELCIKLAFNFGYKYSNPHRYAEAIITAFVAAWNFQLPHLRDRLVLLLHQAVCELDLEEQAPQKQATVKKGGFYAVNSDIIDLLLF